MNKLIPPIWLIEREGDLERVGQDELQAGDLLLEGPFASELDSDQRFCNLCDAYDEADNE